MNVGFEIDDNEMYNLIKHYINMAAAEIIRKSVNTKSLSDDIRVEISRAVRAQVAQFEGLDDLITNSINEEAGKNIVKAAKEASVLDKVVKELLEPEMPAIIDRIVEQATNNIVSKRIKKNILDSLDLIIGINGKDSAEVLKETKHEQSKI